jgi:hypothetical protein
MALGDLFKSKQERERDLAKKRRKAFREAENAVDVVKERVTKLKQERDKAWAEARKYLGDGQKGAAQRCLQTCRASEMMMSKLEMKRWVFEQMLTKLELAKTDQEFAGALKAIDVAVKVDPEMVADVLGDIRDKLGEQEDVDKEWVREFNKEMEGVETKMTDTVPSLDEMEKQLQDEVAAEIGGATSSRSKESQAALKDKIGEGRKKLRDLLEGEK